MITDEYLYYELLNDSIRILRKMINYIKTKWKRDKNTKDVLRKMTQFIWCRKIKGN